MATLPVPALKGIIGVKPVMSRKPMGPGRSLGRAAIEPLRVVQMTLTSFVRIFTGAEQAQLAGPVAVSREVGRAHERGIGAAIYLVARLSAYVWPVFVGARP